MRISQKAIDRLTELVADILVKDREVRTVPQCDFERFLFELRLCDVILIEGRSRVSDVIKTISLSCWTHSVLYIGRLNDIENLELRRLAKSYYPGSPDDQLIIESLLGEGTIISPLKKYQYDNIRICRPRDLSPRDAQKVIESAVKYLGSGYSTRQLFDLARFLFPYGLLPRRWRSSLFRHHAGESTRTICSTMIVESFASAHYPVLPVIQRTKENKLKWFRRNANIITPRDFDYSPFFDIIKFPFMGDEMCVYRNLPWDKNGVIYNDEMECLIDQSKCDDKNKGKKQRILWSLLQRRGA
ncbi:MAG: YiiX/YebB-like N1pC/P60 family cysteine hydrolase [Nitrospirota bacterium]